MKTKTIAIVLIGWMILAGCEKVREPVVIDPELQKELDEFERRLDDKTASYAIANRPTNVVPATDTTQASPALENEGVTATPKTATSINVPSVDGDDVPDFDISNKDMISSIIDDSFPNDDSKAGVDPSKVPQPSESSDALSQAFDSSTPAAVAGSNETNVADSSAAGEKPKAVGLSRESTPEQVCETFLDALSRADHLAANHILTNVAQIETARAKLVLESPGGPESSFEVMPAKYATSARKVAQVLCLLQQQGQTDPVRLTWMMRFQYNGWKISGMSIQMEPDGPADLLSFENPNDLNRIQSTVDESDAPTRTAESDSGTSDR